MAEAHHSALARALEDARRFTPDTVMTALPPPTPAALASLQRGA